ncbi:aminotransferase class I/II-fold pyridoxal phosphate-dependent enzyme [Terasakiella pusilla]|uniref:aminotransferase class I/II-fold pyridoxal phosphate-dependent enzyme n=1 Tax=Terasakiella pusilla TaxID=64973 RepID=UPI00146FB761|nr:aminotransferase class I/II-fold pyridoxal phosphate-dependent enzyme [Terasakiella pusilla]
MLAKKNKISVTEKSDVVDGSVASSRNMSLKEGIADLKKSFAKLKLIRQESPIYRSFEGMMKPILLREGQEVINFSGYDYLGFASDQRVQDAAIEAIKTMGTSVSASRIASGQRPLHSELEKEIADLFGVEDALVMVGGYSTNQTVISHIVGKDDLIIHDALMHRSAIDGAMCSGAKRLAFPHNDLGVLENILIENRKDFRQCLILIEGIYSVDGDLPDLARIIELKKRHDCFLFVDEAHSLGVLGVTGKGIGEHAGINPKDVDFWMATLSKSFASCGGAIAGKADVIEYLRYTTPGFVYSVGITPANAAAALKSIQLLKDEPQRATKVKENGRYFYDRLVQNGLNTGLSEGYNIVPVVVGNSLKTIKLSNALLDNDINTQAFFYPAVAENEARLRFFVTAEHTKEQLSQSADIIAKLYKKLF